MFHMNGAALIWYFTRNFLSRIDPMPILGESETQNFAATWPMDPGSKTRPPGNWICGPLLQSSVLSIQLCSLWLTNIYLRDAPLWEKCSFFEHCSKGLCPPPPPFYLNICPILRGVFLYVVCMLYVCMGVFVCCMYVVCCINVGVREAPCKKSFGILASYWTPPKIK